MKQSTNRILFGSILTAVMMFGTWNNLDSANGYGASVISLIFVLVGVSMIIKGFKLRKTEIKK